MIDQYEELNHFIRKIRLLNGQTQENIPDEIYKMIRKKANNNYSINILTHRNVHTYLLNSDYWGYIHHSFHILKILKQHQPIIITHNMETELCSLFMQICSINNKLTTNKIIYHNYYLYKLCELFSIDDDLIPLMADASTSIVVAIEARQQQWNEICQILSTEQEIELKNYINTKVIPLLSIILNLRYNHILENISYYIYTSTKNDLFWIKTFNNLV
jgi:hypothetical protein